MESNKPKMEIPQTLSGDVAAQRRQPPKKPKPMPRLAPLDHIKNLYKGALETLPKNPNRKIARKKDLLQAVRKMSPVRPQKLAKTESEFIHIGPQEEPLDSTTKALQELEAGVNANARRYNELRMQAEKKQKELDKLLDEHRELQIENEALAQIKESQSPDTILLAELQQKIAKVEDKMEEKKFRKSQLEFMRDRLKKNKSMFDTHIKTMEDALKASQKELSDVKNYVRMLEESKDQAMYELARLQQTIAEERARREHELEEKKKELKNARRMEEWRRKRESAHKEIAAELRGDLSKEEEERLLRQVRERREESERLAAANKARAQRAAELENAFLDIKKATGVNTLEEMVEKFLGQGANRASLEEEKADAEDRLAKVKAQKEAAERRFAELKASGAGETELSRETYDKMDKEIAEVKAQLKANRASCERLEGVLVAVRQGSLGLSQRLAQFNELLKDTDEGFYDSDGDDDGDLRSPTASGTLDPRKQGATSLKLLMKCERKLVKMLELMGRMGSRATDDEEGPRGDAAAEPSDANVWSPRDNDDPALHMNNVRVVPRAEADTATATPRSAASEDDTVADHSSSQAQEDVVMDRTHIKHRAQQKAAEAVKRREQQAKREARKNKIDRNKEKKMVMERLVNSHPEPVGLTFLTQKPDLL